MKAIILAAGYGNRMRPLTDKCHKTMLKIGDQTIIERIIDGLVANEVTDIMFVTGYRGQELTQYLTDRYPDLNLSFVHNARYRQTNNIFSLSLAFDQVTFDDDVMLIESDLIYEPAVIDRVIRSKHANVALVDRFRSGMDGTVVTVENQVITNVIPPHLQPDNFDFSDKFKTLNIYRFSKEFCASTFKKLLHYYANAIDDNCYYELILGILIYMQRETVHAEILDEERWAEVDDPNDLSIADFVFNDSSRRPLLEKSYGGFWNYDVIDFCYIRNMYFPTDAMISEMRNNLPELIRNYGSVQPLLNRKAAYFLLCNEQNVNVLNGASQAYPMLQSRFEGKRVLLASPTFGEYTRIFPHHECYDDKVGLDRDQIEGGCEKCELIVIVNPNNPTGSVLPSDWIHQLAAERPDKTFLVDESFIEFSPYESVIRQLEKQPLDNVIVIKSLSKSLGMPGLRLGYLYACDIQFNEFVRAHIPIWNLNSLAEFALETMLKHRNVLDQSYAHTIRDREVFAKALGNGDVIEEVYPSAGNFILISLESDVIGTVDLVETLLSRHGTFVHDSSSKFDAPGKYFRFAVRLPAENAHLASLLTRSNLCPSS